ncbi:ribonuclease H-like domain-containing protein [Candidatus Uhrbacteria bacterium]|nr:ribonuclease H-like domain-containing protein [Candidatus Uhrbacteria bacterium]
MSKEVVFDIETQSAAGFDYKQMRVSVVGVYFYETDEFACYEEAELPKLWSRLERADRLIGYNSRSFDVPILNNYYPGDLGRLPQLDILEEIHKTLGFRLKLDHVAQTCLGVGKSGHGLQAVEWWKQGEIQKIKDYCLQDVKVTRDVYEYGLKYGALAYEDRAGGRKAIPVDFRLKQAVSSINLSLGL